MSGTKKNPLLTLRLLLLLLLLLLLRLRLKKWLSENRQTRLCLFHHQH